MAQRRKFKPLYSLSSHHPAGGKRVFIFGEQRLRIHIEREDYNELLDIAEEMMERKPGTVYKSKRIHAGCDASERTTTIDAERKTGF
jgi:hypothetical protein